jgi:hypothetical protein
LHDSSRIAEGGLWPSGDGVSQEYGESRDKGHVGTAGGEIAIGMLVRVWDGDMCGTSTKGGEEGVVVLGKVVSKSGGDGVGEREGEDVVEQVGCRRRVVRGQGSGGWEVWFRVIWWPLWDSVCCVCRWCECGTGSLATLGCS